MIIYLTPSPSPNSKRGSRAQAEGDTTNGKLSVPRQWVNRVLLLEEELPLADSLPALISEALGDIPSIVSRELRLRRGRVD